ncbi:hypothetical protein ScPMuIL_018772 [Solemya velum]
MIHSLLCNCGCPQRRHVPLDNTEVTCWCNLQGRKVSFPQNTRSSHQLAEVRVANMNSLVVVCLLLGAANGYSKFIEIVTFNTGLFPAINVNVDTRCQEQITILEDQLVDDAIICLQGVMFTKHLKQIIEGLAHRLPYSVSFIHQNTDNQQTTSEDVAAKAPCNNDDAVVLESMSSCRGIVQCLLLYNHAGNDQLRCASKYPVCLEILRNLSHDCLTCMFLHVTKDLPEVVCQKASTVLNIPGLVLLSSLSMSEIETGFLYNRSETRIQPAAYIKANVDSVGEFVCTHLASDVGSLEVDVNGKTFAFENSNDATRLIEIVESYRDVIIAGDLGFSLPSTFDRYDQSRHVRMRYPESARKFHAARIRNEDHFSDCTYCFGNPLVSDDITVYRSSGYAPDQILFRGGAMRSIDDYIDVDHKYGPLVSRLVMKAGTNGPLSDHYAMRAQLPNPRWGYEHETEDDRNNDDYDDDDDDDDIFGSVDGEESNDGDENRTV